MSVAYHLSVLRKQIETAAISVGRDPSAVELIAVSKKQPLERIQAALEAGQLVFGENRVQEAQEHWTALKPDYPDLKLHLIGPLQTNKVKEAIALFDVIETLDREKLAQRLSQEMQKQERVLPCFIQVNTGEEPQKSGIVPRDLSDFLDFCRGECGLNISGLMCIPPVDEPPALHFGLLQKLAENHGLTQLSMGMSGDFEKAIALGATSIRIGTAVFGARQAA